MTPLLIELKKGANAPFSCNDIIKVINYKSYVTYFPK